MTQIYTSDNNHFANDFLHIYFLLFIDYLIDKTGGGRESCLDWTEDDDVDTTFQHTGAQFLLRVSATYNIDEQRNETNHVM